MKRLAVLRTIVPALLAVGLMGVLPNWVTLAEAETYLSPEDAVKNSANVLSTALANRGAITSAIANRTGGRSSSTAGGFRIDGVRFGGVQFEGRSPLVEDSAAGSHATGQLGGFLTAVGGFGDQEGVLDYTSGGLIGGIDYQFSDEVVGGLSINWINTDTDYAEVGNGSDRDSYGASLYAAYSVDRLNVTGLFNYSFSDYAMTRVTNVDVATGTNNSDEIFLSAGVSYDCEMLGWTVGPTARMDLVKVWMDGYSETGSAVNADYAAFDVTSFTTDLGIDASYEIKTGGGVIRPRVHAYWVHEYENDSQILSASGFAPIVTDSPDRNYMRIGAGATMELGDGLQIYADWEGLVGFQDINSHQISAGGRFEF